MKTDDHPEENADKSEKENSRLKKLKRRKRLRIMALSLVVVLIAVRIWLPTYIRKELVASINAVEGYSCELEDVDLALYRGGMVLENLKIELTENNVSKPFVILPNTDISVEWSAIFDGSIVGEIILSKPHIYFTDGAEEEDEQVGGAAWTEPILDFIPLEINRFVVDNGTIEFENEDSSPKIDVQVHQINLLVTNIRNTTDNAKPLPSELHMDSKIYQQGDLKIDGRLNILKEIPDMDLDIQAKAIELTQLNSIWEEYASLDFESGSFSMASEFIMKDKQIDGYVKPILDNVSIFKFDEEGTFLNKTWQAIAGFAFEITENQKLDRTATKIPIYGSYDDPDTDVLSAVLRIFRNAFFKAYNIDIDDTVNFNGNGSGNGKSVGEKIKDAFTSD